MTNYQIQLNNGQVINFTSDNFDSTNYTSMLNTPTNVFIDVGGNIINKNIIISIIKVEAPAE